MLKYAKGGEDLPDLRITFRNPRTLAHVVVYLSHLQALMNSLTDSRPPRVRLIRR